MPCPATIQINGQEYQCELENGDSHFNLKSDYPAHHKIRIPDATGRSGVIVQWSYYRTIQPLQQ